LLFFFCPTNHSFGGGLLWVVTEGRGNMELKKFIKHIVFNIFWLFHYHFSFWWFQLSE
jgi:hypothetical protein